MMKAMRARTSSSCASSIGDESTNDQNLTINKKKSKKKYKSRKSQKNISETSGDVYRNTSMQHKKEAVAKNKLLPNLGKSIDIQKSVNDKARKSSSAGRGERKTKQKLYAGELCLTFENAVTSTAIKPKKQKKRFTVSSVNKIASDISSKAHDSSTSTVKAPDTSSEMNRLTPKQSKKQKRRKRKQNNQSNDQHTTSEDTEGTGPESEIEHKYVRSVKSTSPNISIVDNAIFEADIANIQKNKSETTISDFEDRDSDIVFTKVINSTFDEASFKEHNSDVDSVTINNTTFDTEISPKSNKQHTLRKSFFVVSSPEISAKSRNSTYDNNIIKNKTITSVMKSSIIGHKSANIQNSTFEVEDISTMTNNSVKDVSNINNGTFDINNSSLKQIKLRRSNSFVVTSNNKSHKNSKSILNSSVNQTIDIADTRYNNEHENFADKSLLIFENQTRENDFEKLDDISDVIFDEIINISDDSYMNSSVKLNTFDISEDSTSGTFVKTNITKSDSFEEQVLTKSGEWQVEDLTENINTEMGSDNMSTTKVDSQINISIRKKWQKFAVNSPAANSILEQIGTPTLRKDLFSARKTVDGHTPCVVNNSTLKRFSSPKPNPKLLSHKSVSKIKSIIANKPKFLVARTIKPNTQSNTSNVKVNSVLKPDNLTRRIAMPNFAQIHQKAYEKMESLEEYSNRKKQRAKLLMSADKLSNSNVSSKKIVSKGTHEKDNGKQTKSSRQLFADSSAAGYNRFGFQSKEIPVKKQPKLVKRKVEINFASIDKTTRLPVRQLIKPKVIINGVASKKEPIFERKDILAMGNKNKVENITKNRENRREVLKGVRTNRRFDLLMKMRNN